MNIPCESYIKEYLPKIRQQIVIDLVKTHGYTQTKASKALGITQASVSKYLSSPVIKFKNKDLNQNIEEIASELSPAILRNEPMEFDYNRVCNYCTHRDESSLICSINSRASKSATTQIAAIKEQHARHVVSTHKKHGAEY
ncbi:MAG: hypothetical protein J4215_04820 [Candidatus Diapherotrites archaeon]|uniref:Helix-turn-helix domain-containing protein n=1 Tax=Candidatus Iainarchaeum sp. TaxID=3101447 RepID=A0A8T4LF03_9ARCH|nr:hypothetical protein [Candidatus Diapherotrites archaeon]